MAKVVFSSPSNGISPTFLGRLSSDFVVNLKWKIRLRLEGFYRLYTNVKCLWLQRIGQDINYRLHGEKLCDICICEDSNL